MTINDPFIDGLPIKNGDFPWQAVSHNQMVRVSYSQRCMTWICSAAAIPPLRSYHLRATRKRIHLGSSLRLAVGWVWEVYHESLRFRSVFFVSPRVGLGQFLWTSWILKRISTYISDLDLDRPSSPSKALPWRQDDRCRGMGHHEGVARHHQRGDQPALALLHSNPGGPRHRPRQESTALVCADYCALGEMWMIWITPRSSLSGW